MGPPGNGRLRPRPASTTASASTVTLARGISTPDWEEAEISNCRHTECNFTSDEHHDCRSFEPPEPKQRSQQRACPGPSHQQSYELVPQAGIPWLPLGTYYSEPHRLEIRSGPPRVDSHGKVVLPAVALPSGGMVLFSFTMGSRRHCSSSHVCDVGGNCDRLHHSDGPPFRHPAGERQRSKDRQNGTLLIYGGCTNGKAMQLRTGTSTYSCGNKCFHPAGLETRARLQVQIYVCGTHPHDASSLCTSTGHHRPKGPDPAGPGRASRSAHCP